MDWKINPSSKLSGAITPPPDKSITHRAIMISALAEGESKINNYLVGEDCISTINAFQTMGVKIHYTDKELVVKGVGLKGLKKPTMMVSLEDGTLVPGFYAANSGTTVRLISGILAGQSFSCAIKGDNSLSKRPMKRIIGPLRLMGADITAANDNFLPMVIKGKDNLKAINYSTLIASAQVKSCLLFAGMQLSGEMIISEPEKSRDHTERMLKAAGADISIDGLTVKLRGPVKLKPQNITVPGDISSAAFFLAAGTIVPNTKIILNDVGINATRSGIIKTLEEMDADILIKDIRESSGEMVANMEVKTSKLFATKIVKSQVPSLIDEIPIIALCATQAKGKTDISGAKELRVKESDRIKTVISELSKLGAIIKEKDDGMIIEGPVKLKGAEVDSHGDHRIAMMLAIAGLIAEGQTIIKNTKCAFTSFPNFVDLMKNIGVDIVEEGQS